MPVGYVHAAVVNYSYDALGRLTKADYSGDMTATIAYEYDETGNWTLVTATRTTP
jgi:RHS Repeat